MKKILVGIASVGVIGIGSVFVVSSMEKEEPNTTQAQASEDVSESTISVTQTEEPAEKEVVEIPTERTVEATNPPWQQFKKDYIQEMQDEGETIYLYSDAEGIEQFAINTINAEVPEGAPSTKADIAESASGHINLFIREVSKYVDNTDYFNKMQEVQQALADGQYDQVPKLIEEAKTMRES